MNKILVADIKPGMYFDEPVYLDGRYILLGPDVPASEDLLAELNRWNYTAVFTPGDPQGEVRAAALIGSNANLDQDQKEREGLDMAQQFYDDFLDFTQGVYDHFKKTNSLHLERITEYIKKTIELLKGSNQYILRFSELQNNAGKEYMITHAVKTTILALTMAMNVKTTRIPPHKIIELGISCLLHEIGMLQIPAQLYNKQGDLTPEERKTITAHPILGFRLLKEMKDIRPLSQDILLGVLEHHERENGSGYPQALTGEKISLYGKIIAIACSYDAQISNRPHRQSKDGHSSMTSLLKEMQSLYDSNYIGVLMSSLSLFPIGSYVVLGDESVATVVRASEENVRLPFVKIVVNPDKIPSRDFPVVQTQPKGELSIRRVLDDREVADLKSKSLI